MLEREGGKMPKPKEAPRLIDIDLLFYGDTVLYSPELVVPPPAGMNAFLYLHLFRSS